MRKTIYAKENCWLTQSPVNKRKPRIFLKSISVNYPDCWENWTEEQYQEYIKEHGKPGLKELIECANSVPIE